MIKLIALFLGISGTTFILTFLIDWYIRKYIEPQSVVKKDDKDFQNLVSFFNLLYHFIWGLGALLLAIISVGLLMMFIFYVWDIVTA